MTSLGGSYPAIFAAAETSQTKIQLSTLGEDDAAAAKKLFLALVMLTDDAVLRIVQSVQDGNSLEALQRLTNRLNPVTQDRVLSILNTILQVDLGADEKMFMDRLLNVGRRSLSSSTLAVRFCRTSSSGPSSPSELRSPSAPTCW